MSEWLTFGHIVGIYFLGALYGIVRMIYKAGQHDDEYWNNDRIAGQLVGIPFGIFVMFYDFVMLVWFILHVILQIKQDWSNPDRDQLRQALKARKVLMRLTSAQRKTPEIADRIASLDQLIYQLREEPDNVRMIDAEAEADLALGQTEAVVQTNDELRKAKQRSYRTQTGQ